jgi:hypothetical protein
MQTKPWQSKQTLYQTVLNLKQQHQYISNAAIGRLVGLSGQRIGLILTNYSGVK